MNTILSVSGRIIGFSLATRLLKRGSKVLLAGGLLASEVGRDFPSIINVKGERFFSRSQTQSEGLQRVDQTHTMPDLGSIYLQHLPRRVRDPNQTGVPDAYERKESIHIRHAETFAAE